MAAALAFAKTDPQRASHPVRSSCLCLAPWLMQRLICFADIGKKCGRAPEAYQVPYKSSSHQPLLSKVPSLRSSSVELHLSGRHPPRGAGPAAFPAGFCQLLTGHVLRASASFRCLHVLALLNLQVLFGPGLATTILNILEILGSHLQAFTGIGSVAASDVVGSSVASCPRKQLHEALSTEMQRRERLDKWHHSFEMSRATLSGRLQLSVTQLAKPHGSTATRQGAASTY